MLERMRARDLHEHRPTPQEILASNGDTVVSAALEPSNLPQISAYINLDAAVHVPLPHVATES